MQWPMASARGRSDDLRLQAAAARPLPAACKARSAVILLPPSGRQGGGGPVTTLGRGYTQGNTTRSPLVCGCIVRIFRRCHRAHRPPCCLRNRVRRHPARLLRDGRGAVGLRVHARQGGCTRGGTPHTPCVAVKCVPFRFRSRRSSIAPPSSPIAFPLVRRSRLPRRRPRARLSSGPEDPGDAPFAYCTAS